MIKIASKFLLKLPNYLKITILTNISRNTILTNPYFALGSVMASGGWGEGGWGSYAQEHTHTHTHTKLLQVSYK